MTRVVVNDASCLIDLRKDRLLPMLCRLPYRFVVPLPIRESEMLNLTAREWESLDHGGMETHDLPPDQMIAHRCDRRSARWRPAMHLRPESDCPRPIRLRFALVAQRRGERLRFVQPIENLGFPSHHRKVAGVKAVSAESSAGDAACARTSPRRRQARTGADDSVSSCSRTRFGSPCRQPTCPVPWPPRSGGEGSTPYSRDRRRAGVVRRRSALLSPKFRFGWRLPRGYVRLGRIGNN